MKHLELNGIVNNLAVGLMKDPAHWMGFLGTAAFMYKYPFLNQLAIYAQRPDATACASFELWNKLGCFIKSGAKGIAIFDNNSGSDKINYIFDITDTVANAKQPPEIWRLTKENGNDVAKKLLYNAELEYTSEEVNFRKSLVRTINTTVDENYSAYYGRLDKAECSADSFKRLLKNSVLYTVEQRCDIKHKALEFSDLEHFGTRKVILALGTANRDISHDILIQIERAVKDLERSKRHENERNKLHKGRGRDAISQPNNIGEQLSFGNVRQSEVEVSGERGQNNLRPTAAGREAEHTLQGDGRTGRDDGRTVDSANAQEEPAAHGLHGTGELQQPPVPDDERNGAEGTDIQLDSEQAQAEPEETSGFYISDEEFDVYLKTGSHFENGKYRIYNYLKENHTGSENAQFLKNEYGIGGSTYYFTNGLRGGSTYDGKGVELCYREQQRALSWPKVAGRIKNLVEAGEYLTSEEVQLQPYYTQYDIYRNQYYAEEGRITTATYRLFDEAIAQKQFDLYVGALVCLGDSEFEIKNIEGDVIQLSGANTPLVYENWNRDTLLEALKASHNANRHLVMVDLPINEYGKLLNLEDWAAAQIAEAEIPNSFSGTIEIEPIESDARGIYSTKAPERVTFWDRYTEVKKEHPDSIVLHQMGDFYEMYEEDAVTAAGLLELHLNERTLNGGTKINMCGMPSHKLSDYTNILKEHGHYVAVIHADKSRSQNHRITDAAHGTYTTKTRYDKNIAAIKLLKALEQEQRSATAAEQAVLSGYTGWGALPQVFDKRNAKWATKHAQLKALLTSEEYTAASKSTLNAHFTSPAVIKSMYDVLGNLGFKSGNILEPACGTGNFLGMLPENMQGSMLYGVELDDITAKIAAQLYPTANIQNCGFENTVFESDFFDVVIGNVPFGAYKVHDPKYNKHNFFIHDYFIAKSIEKVRPGGVVAIITSKGTMDKANNTVRRYLAQNAELLGAMRLPNNAFKANAGTEVTSDILFFKKRERPMDIDEPWVYTGLTEDGVPINSYYAEHPEMVLGRMVFSKSMYGKEDDTACLPFDGIPLPELLEAAVKNINAHYVEAVQDIDSIDDVAESIPADPNVKNYTYTIHEGEIYYRNNSVMEKADINATAAERVRGMIGIRNVTRDIIYAQLHNFPDDEVTELQRKLNIIYDNYTLKYGILNNRGNKLAFKEDTDYPLLCSLEVLNDDSEFLSKADFFTKRTVRPIKVITHADSPQEALILSMAERGRIDFGYMSELCGLSEDEVISQLSKAGEIFRLPQFSEPQWAIRDEYLSGNVREKLDVAKELANEDAEFAVNVAALEAVQPEDIPAADIDIALGSTWIPESDIRDFIVELLEPRSFYKINVEYSSYTSEWKLTDYPESSMDVLSTKTYGTERMNAYRIIDSTLNLRPAKVYDSVWNSEKGRNDYVLNQSETVQAQEKQELIKERFKDWIFADTERRTRLAQKYNDEYNNLRPRVYNGDNLIFHGMNPEISLRKHQRDAIARVLYGGNTLLGHVVGSGKTWTSVAAIQEARYMGLCKKAMICVPNHLVEQWASEYLQLYPAANILVVNKSDFEKSKRRTFCARIATGDYDAVILGHSQLEKIPMSDEWQREYMQKEIDTLTFHIQESRGKFYTIKQLEKIKANLKARLSELDNMRRDDVLSFEELGIDQLYIDEADLFKNLFYVTKMRNVAGLPQTSAKKASDLFMKTRYLDEITNDKGVVFATGTTISNSIAELYTMQKYLSYDTLSSRGLLNFDSWATLFTEQTLGMELAPSGKGYRMVTRLNTFKNLPELSQMVSMFADIQTAADLDLPVPKVRGGKPAIVSVEPSEIQTELVDRLVKRAEAIRDGQVAPQDDNMLLVTNDGRKLALDQRLIASDFTDDPNSKINAVVSNVHRIWQDKQQDKATQLVFCDLSTPRGDGQFNVYDDIKRKLVAQNVPEKEIAFIHDAKTDIQKAKLFGKVNSGKVRILIGSTEKMGAGTNVQRRLCAVHHTDVPWRPRDLEQRDGRIIRQGNMYDEVDIFRYVTKGTFDAYSYQTLENKSKFISQFMSNKNALRRMDFDDDNIINYATIKAIASGDERVFEKCSLDIDIQRLKTLKRQHREEQFRLQEMIDHKLPGAIDKSRRIVELCNTDLTELDKQQGFEIKVGGKVYSDIKEAGVELREAIRKIDGFGQTSIARLGHFDIRAEHKPFQDCASSLSLHGEHTYFFEDVVKSKYVDMALIADMRSYVAEMIGRHEGRIADYTEQLNKARLEYGAPFAHEAELQTKIQRVTQLNIELDVNKKDPQVLQADYIGTEEPAEEKSMMER